MQSICTIRKLLLPLQQKNNNRRLLTTKNRYKNYGKEYYWNTD